MCSVLYHSPPATHQRIDIDIDIYTHRRGVVLLLRIYKYRTECTYGYLYPGGLIITDSLWQRPRCALPPSPADIKRKSAPITHAETEENCCTRAIFDHFAAAPCAADPFVFTRESYPLAPTPSVQVPHLFLSRSFRSVHTHTHTHTTRLLYQAILCAQTLNRLHIVLLVKSIYYTSNTCITQYLLISFGDCFRFVFIEFCCCRPTKI